ncbi:MAG: hypothetical protein WAN57_01580 [Smithella sp.]
MFAIDFHLHPFGNTSRIVLSCLLMGFVYLICGLTCALTWRLTCRKYLYHKLQGQVN